MPTNTKISALTEETTPVGTDQMVIERSATSNYRVSLTNLVTNLGTLKTLWDANTILKADSDDTPTALTVGEQTLVGRITSGVITALSVAQVRTLLGALYSSAAITDHAIPRGNGGAYELQDSGVLIDDSDNLTGVAAITATGDIDTTGDVTGLMPGATNASTTIAAADSMRGQCVYCTAGSAVTFNFSDTPSTDLSFVVAQWGAGQVSFAHTGSGTIRKAATFNAATAEQYSMVFVHVKANSGDVALSGDLELA